MSRISASTVKAWLEDGAAYIVDIREELSATRFPIAPATNLPFSKIQDVDIPEGKKLVIICDHGEASEFLVDVLEECGIEAFSVIGGAQAWYKMQK